MGVEGKGGLHDVRRNLMSINVLLRNSTADDQSGVQLLLGVGVGESPVLSQQYVASRWCRRVASPESAVCSQSLVSASRQS